jgi:hypothetical protein
MRPERSDSWTTARTDARAAVQGLQVRGGKLVRDRAAYAAMSAAVILLSLASVVYARGASVPYQTTRTQDASQSTSPNAGAAAQTDKAGTPGPQGKTVGAGEAAVEPLLREYKGVTLGMSAGDVRAKLGEPEEKGEAMDFFVFSEQERARVYYREGSANAIIATYIGKSSGTPTPLAVLGTEIEAKPDGSLYKMVQYPQAGYWVAYSLIPGDSPMVMITMQKMN